MPPFRQAHRAGSSPRADTMSTFALSPMQVRRSGYGAMQLAGQARSASSSSGLFSSPSYHWPPQPVLTT
jgi:hypothetical protein